MQLFEICCGPEGREGQGCRASEVRGGGLVTAVLRRRQTMKSAMLVLELSQAQSIL
jgi:hypothetical protein